MRSAGYTLIELLIVISIIALLSVVGFVNFKDFSAGQVIVRAEGEAQTLLRLAQSNATSSTLCNNPLSTNKGSVSWKLVFTNFTSIALQCDTAIHSNYLVRTYTLQNAQFSIKGSGCGSATAGDVTLTYTTGVGALAVSTTDLLTSTCLTNSGSIIFTISKPTGSSSTASSQSFTINKGGAIDVQ